jgi:lathosterol oxidase
MDVRSVLDTWRQVLTVDFLRYFLTAAPFYLVFWVWRPKWLRGRRLQSTDPGRARVLSEVAYSLSTVVIFSVVGLSLLYAQRTGLTRIYLGVPERGWAYLGASTAVAVLVHDAYFYWTHRLLHWRPLYRAAHHVHHRSTSPTPWAAYAFHPIEALIQAGVYVLIVFTIPMHPLALMVFLVYMIVRNVVGHLGFEIWPSGFARHPLTRWHLTPTHHDLHHHFGRGNYGFYFSFWDDWAGTSREDYPAAYDAVTARQRALRRPAAAAVGLVLGLAAAGWRTTGADLVGGEVGLGRCHRPGPPLVRLPEPNGDDGPGGERQEADDPHRGPQAEQVGDDAGQDGTHGVAEIPPQPVYADGGSTPRRMRHVPDHG